MIPEFAFFAYPNLVSRIHEVIGAPGSFGGLVALGRKGQLSGRSESFSDLDLAFLMDYKNAVKQDCYRSAKSVSTWFLLRPRTNNWPMDLRRGHKETVFIPKKTVNNYMSTDMKKENGEGGGNS